MILLITGYLEVIRVESNLVEISWELFQIENNNIDEYRVGKIVTKQKTPKPKTRKEARHLLFLANANGYPGTDNRKYIISPRYTTFHSNRFRELSIFNVYSQLF